MYSHLINQAKVQHEPATMEDETLTLYCVQCPGHHSKKQAPHTYDNNRHNTLEWTRRFRVNIPVYIVTRHLLPESLLQLRMDTSEKLQSMASLNRQLQQQ